MGATTAWSEGTVVLLLGAAFALSACATGDRTAVGTAAAPGVAGEPAGAAADAERRYRETFEAMLADLANPERSFEFVQAAVEAGDLRGAAAALERILLINPDLANIKLELGVLYQRLGATDLGAVYIREALEAEDVPPEVRERAEAILAAPDVVAPRRHFVGGSVFVGGRYDTNANAGPATRRIRIFGFEGPFLDEEFTEDEDFSVVGTAELRYAYAFDDLGRTALEADLLGFAQRYFDVDEFNTALVGLDLGPRFTVGDAARPLSLRPFGTASYLRLGGERYRATAGGGLDIVNVFSPQWLGRARIMAEQERFFDTDDRPTADDKTGPTVSALGALTFNVLPRTQLGARAVVGRHWADEDFESFYEVGGQLSVTQYFPAPFGLTAQPWSASLAAAVRYTAYDEPEVQIDPDTERQDTRYDVTATGVVPLLDGLSLVLSGGYTNNDSNVPNFEYDNIFGTAGVGYSF